ncbi:universal stress protein [Mangrovimicrobium sediminis]|uniref:Universal stress protein n=1 Tax=Mangrovimicrobium sediminis TaxID=2562682 RepID=A0A4Z0M219_9GAMM|nr:universal stress protein [Haliea sp. SAOS-164]TGD73579.1 universal stress protein [Haliea sp. SAOS-164]
MSNYKKILVAVDLSDESQIVAKKAQAIADGGSAQLDVIHVIEPLSFAYGVDIPMDFSGLQEEIQTQATQQLTRFAEQNGISATHQHVVLGRPEVEIHAMAEQIGADLIVVGSHGRYGLALLMGSTANGVLHGATCDVLAVRVGD